MEAMRLSAKLGQLYSVTLESKSSFNRASSPLIFITEL